MQKIGEIKCEIQAAEPGEYATLFEKYKEDTRSGARKLLEQLHKKEEAYQKELLRTEKMKEFERKYEDLGYVCGIDEVGRGPLAGPVVAGAVILPRDCKILYLNDSKQLSAKKRDELYDVIMENAVAVGIGMASPRRIDEINILQATYEAMREAALFFVDYLTENEDGELVTCPSVSPENTYKTESGAKGCLCSGPFMDTEILTVLFRNVIESSKLLNRDGDFAAELEGLLKKLPPLKIGKYGQIQEWAKDYEEVEIGHRHISHLFALYPADLITPYHTPELGKAARATLIRRLIHGGGKSEAKRS